MSSNPDSCHCGHIRRIHFNPILTNDKRIWSIDEHKHEDIETKGDCCFNHIIGLPTKERIEKPIFDYQQNLYDGLLISDN